MYWCVDELATANLITCGFSWCTANSFPAFGLQKYVIPAATQFQMDAIRSRPTHFPLKYARLLKQYGFRSVFYISFKLYGQYFSHLLTSFSERSKSAFQSTFTFLTRFNKGFHPSPFSFWNDQLLCHWPAVYFLKYKFEPSLRKINQSVSLEAALIGTDLPAHAGMRLNLYSPPCLVQLRVHKCYFSCFPAITLLLVLIYCLEM